MTTSEHVFVLKGINQSLSRLSSVALARFCKYWQCSARKDLMHLTAGVEEECATVNGSAGR